MMNMGGPATPEETGPFLQRLFSDGEIIQLGPLQNTLGPFIAKRRTPKITEQYQAIGGSPIRKWTEIQGAEMVRKLDILSPSTAPHKFYVAFRYADPLTEETVDAMVKDGVQRAVAFSQYPQYSCTTTGSSLNHLWRTLQKKQVSDRITWSVIDRWPTHPTFIKAVANRVQMGLAQLPNEEARRKAILLFSAHSLPMRVVNRGDPYAQEVGATVSHVVQALGHNNPYILSWQSQVGPLPWLGPQTGSVLEGLGKQGHENVVVVPIAFTSDHVETLWEIDREYRHVAHQAGVKNFVLAPSLNDEPLLSDAQAEIVSSHLSSGAVCSPQYPLNCAMCVNPMCRTILNPVKPYQKMRDEAQAAKQKQ